MSKKCACKHTWCVQIGGHHRWRYFNNLYKRVGFLTNHCNIKLLYRGMKKYIEKKCHSNSAIKGEKRNEMHGGVMTVLLLGRNNFRKCWQGYHNAAMILKQGWDQTVTSIAQMFCTLPKLDEDILDKDATAWRWYLISGNKAKFLNDKLNRDKKQNNKKKNS